MSKVDEYVKAIPNQPRIRLGDLWVEVSRDGGVSIVGGGDSFYLSKERTLSLAQFLAEWYLEATNAQQ